MARDIRDVLVAWVLGLAALAALALALVNCHPV